MNKSLLTLSVAIILLGCASIGTTISMVQLSQRIANTQEVVAEVINNQLLIVEELRKKQ